MKLKNEFQPIRNWATERGLYLKGDSKTQCLKLQEEVGELSRALLKNEHDEVVDAIGDIVVVLTNLSELVDVRIEDCINSAYEVIKNRKGEMKNGTFIKQI
jgi:NTP pyrophosphatase (non-canonical NTP hydrolase)